MFWIILTLVQLVLWWITFFKTKKLVRVKVESRWNSTTWSEFTLSDERYKFPLGIVLLGFLLCFIPIFGLIVYIVVSANISNMSDRNFEGERPSFALVELFKKKI